MISFAILQTKNNNNGGLRKFSGLFTYFEDLQLSR